MAEPIFNDRLGMIFTKACSICLDTITALIVLYIINSLTDEDSCCSSITRSSNAAIIAQFGCTFNSYFSL